MDYKNDALAIHKKYKGKLGIEILPPVNEDTLTLLYSPGVAEPCKEIAVNPDLVAEYTWRQNTVAVISDGSAVLGLGNIGAKAAIPVMEGKALLMKSFANLNGVPIVLDTQDTDMIIQTVKMLAPSFGAINLEDISAPRCVIIERELEAALDIPIFHDDQHGTAIVVMAALINSLKLAQKQLADCKVVVSGAGAAGSSIIKLLHTFGCRNIVAFDVNGVITENPANDFLQAEIAELTNGVAGTTFEQAFVGADIFIGVSAAGIVKEAMIRAMNDKAIVFAMANPEPEIGYDAARAAGAFIVGTGRSDFPNQINNLLAFPGIFRGALDVGAKKITMVMKMAAVYAIADLIDDADLREDYVIASPFTEGLTEQVARAVAAAAKQG
ncbi:NAD(P)-dependent malic enzyme [Culicoidibacter larvae]|uniref:NADP-dependent malic enzyme n=1 Tax=Culicoidibacter larvae TaxID=2579976 RepID=A0A5R8QHQ8_9FIRM|nr:NADP-dependent malic enzyme [Culicoidibacter larvae]TLG77324.1 NADP-dependent malic enzyme [Culicoidibacter larvae]